MKSIGYVSASNDINYEKEQIDGLNKYRVEKIIYEKDILVEGDYTSDVLEKVVRQFTKGDELVVYELSCTGKSVVQLASFLKRLKQNNINFYEVKKNYIDRDLPNEIYIKIIMKIAEMEKSVIRERTTRGLKEARLKGRVGGRPRISIETIERIKYLNNHKRYTLRQIAQECNISLGTAYKYVQANCISYQRQQGE